MKILNSGYTTVSNLDITSEADLPIGASNKIEYASGEAVSRRVQVAITSLTCTSGATWTIRIYIGLTTGKVWKLSEFTSTPGTSPTALFAISDVVLLPLQPLIRAIYVTAESDNVGDNSADCECQVLDIDKALDIATVNEGSPVTAADVANLILETPANLIKSNSDGSVKTSNGLNR